MWGRAGGRGGGWAGDACAAGRGDGGAAAGEGANDVGHEQMEVGSGGGGGGVAGVGFGDGCSEVECLHALLQVPRADIAGGAGEEILRGEERDEKARIAGLWKGVKPLGRKVTGARCNIRIENKSLVALNSVLTT